MKQKDIFFLFSQCTWKMWCAFGVRNNMEIRILIKKEIIDIERSTH